MILKGFDTRFLLWEFIIYLDNSQFWGPQHCLEKTLPVKKIVMYIYTQDFSDTVSIVCTKKKNLMPEKWKLADETRLSMIALFLNLRFLFS